MGAIKFIIYMECPRGREQHDGGYALDADVWGPTASKQPTSYSDLTRKFCTEMCARLVLLKEMLKYETFTPLHWLLFILSKSGGSIVRRAYDWCAKYICEAAIVNRLLEEIESRVGYFPVLMVDEVQLLAEKYLTFPEVDVKSRTVMAWVMRSVTLLTCPAIWAGTRMGLEAATPLHSAVAKLERKREVIVLDVSNLRSS